MNGRTTTVLSRNTLEEEIEVLTALRDGRTLQAAYIGSEDGVWEDVTQLPNNGSEFSWRPLFSQVHYRIKPKMASHSTKAYLYQSTFTGKRVVLYGEVNRLELGELVLVATTDVHFVWEEK